MPGQMFYWILNMSITATFTGVVLLFLRKIKRIPRRMVFVLWAVPFLRMWVPVSIGSKYGLMEVLSHVGVKTVMVYEGESPVTIMNSIGAADSYVPFAYKAGFLSDIFNTAFVLWLIGCAAFLGMLIFLYIGAKKELGYTTCWRSNIRLSEKISSPAVYGVFHPCIVMPVGYKDKEMTYILAHEKAHIRRLDNFWRLMGFVTVCVHWFNPFSWLFLKAFLEDMELSCDEMVLSGFDEKEKKAYAAALVDCAESRTSFASAFGGAKIHQRISHILSYKKLSLFSTLCFIVLAAAIAYALLTNGI